MKGVCLFVVGVQRVKRNRERKKECFFYWLCFLSELEKKEVWEIERGSVVFCLLVLRVAGDDLKWCCVW